MAPQPPPLSLAKAYLVLVDPPKDPMDTPRLSAVTAKARGASSKDKIEFMFNPEKYTVTKGATWSRKEVRGAAAVADAQFGGTTAGTMTLEILLDHSDKKRPKCAEAVDTMFKAVVPTKETVQSNRPSPPWVVFGWGRRIPMVAVVNSVSATYLMFRPDGTPTRVKISVTMEEVPTDPMPRQNPTSGSEYVLRQHMVVAGDSLPSVATEAYGDASRWRDIAEANRIDDPLSLREGQSLLLPNIAELAERESV